MLRVILEKVFDVLDSRLHEVTYNDLDVMCTSLHFRLIELEENQDNYSPKARIKEVYREN